MKFLWPGNSVPVDAQGKPRINGLFLSASNNLNPRHAKESDLPYVIDNGLFSGATFDDFHKLLASMDPHKDRCRFVVAPDVVGHAETTLDRFWYWGPWLKERGWPVAFVAQDGQENIQLPYPELYDTLFVGATTEWKMGEHAAECIREARRLRKGIHIGRINTISRYRAFNVLRDAELFTCDGTKIRYAGQEKTLALYNRLEAERPMRIL